MKKVFFILIAVFLSVSAFSLSLKTMENDNYPYHLYFPLAFHDTNYISYIGLINLTGESVNYTIHIINSKGERMAQDYSGVLNAKAKLYKEITDIELNEPCWILVGSDGYLTGYMNTISTNKKESYFYLPDTSLSKNIYVPHITTATNYWYTYTALVNGDFSNICSPYFDYFGDQKALSLPTNPLTQGYFEWYSDIFQNNFPDNMNGWGKIFTTGDATLSGMETFKVKSEDIFNEAGLSLPSQLTDTLYFPHIRVEGGYWWTGIAVNNAAEITLPVTFHAMGTDGTELDTVTWFLEPYSKLVTLAQNLWTDKEKDFPEGTAWIKATSTEQKIIGYELFGTLESAGRRLLAGLNSPIEGYKSLIFSHVESNSDFWTGIALVNIGDEPTEVTLTAYDNDGKELGSVVISQNFNPNQKYVDTVKNAFDGQVPEGTTYLKADASEPLVGFELWGNLTVEENGTIINRQEYISGMLAVANSYTVLKEGFENNVISNGTWSVVREKDNQYLYKGWQIASELSLGTKTWAEQFPQTPPEGNDYIVGFYGTTSARNHQYLVSPQLDLPGGASSLSYYFQFGWPETAVTSVKVYITEDLIVTDGIDFTKTTLVKTYTPLYMQSLSRSSEVSDFTVWQKESIDISAFAGKKIRIVFEINSKYEESFHIDNLEVR